MTTNDRNIIRDLAKRIAELAALPIQEAKRQIWYATNSLKPVRPAVFCSPEGSWEELVPESAMTCEDKDARGMERGLRMRIYAVEHFDHDQVCDNALWVRPSIQGGGWNVGPQYIRPEQARGAFRWDSPIKAREDLNRLEAAPVKHDSEATQRNLEFHRELLGDILDVRLRGHSYSYAGLIDEWMYLRGLYQTYWDMADDPEMVHAGLQRLMENRIAFLESLESQGLLGLNNGNDYVGSGGFGFTHDLPAPGCDGQVRLKDLWGFADSQSMSEVSPAMQEEFVLPYQAPILERFGLNCYGCCEPLHMKLPMLKRLVPRLRRVSISPWADKRTSAKALGPDVIFSWKPNPAALAAVEFDGDWVRADIRETIEIAKEHGCVLEMIIKDTHTCNHQPWRFDEWTRIAMEEARRAAD